MNGRHVFLNNLPAQVSGRLLQVAAVCVGLQSSVLNMLPEGKSPHCLDSAHFSLLTPLQVVRLLLDFHICCKNKS